MQGVQMELTLPCPDGQNLYRLKPEKIIALGLNYQDHIDETGTQRPSEPVLFSKTPNVLIGPWDHIFIPSFLGEYGFDDVVVHYEAELAVVVGKRACCIRESEAMDYVLGYSCFNDVSQRNLQFSDISGWFRGKSLDTFGPMGPRIATKKEIPDPHNLTIRCRLNGATVQESCTSKMIFGIPEILAFISRQITLVPGDIVATGTPAGVGKLSHGDNVEIEIEGIGTLSNRVRDESVSPRG
jgi:2-keto-4-pentenoate hydratase/2-oxohepta-3-ene-1,7-dioic acid hydratase in catechol pathway